MSLLFETLGGLDPAVYTAIGPFAMDREVERELGYPIYTTPEHRWIIARSGGVVAFGGLVLVGSDRARLDWTYVVPDHRRKGLFAAIGERKLALCEGRRVTTCTRSLWLLPWFARHGFVPTRPRGEWHYMERP